MAQRKSFATFKNGYTEEIFYFEKCNSDVILFATRSGVYMYRMFRDSPGVMGIRPSTEFFKVHMLGMIPTLDIEETYAIESITLDERVKVRFVIDGKAGEILVAADATDEQIKAAILDEVLEGYEIIKEPVFKKNETLSWVSNQKPVFEKDELVEKEEKRRLLDG